MEFLWNGLLSITWQQAVMYAVGLLLIYLAIEKDYEPALLLPMGFGAILVNIPFSGALNQMMEGVGETHGIVQWLFETGIEASEAFPLLLFIGIGASRLRSLIIQPQDVPVRRGSPVRYFLHHRSGSVPGL